MVIPAILKGTPHLPLTERMTLAQALPVINMFYQTRYEEADFAESQAFRDEAGDLVLEARDPATGDVLIRFVNKCENNQVTVEGSSVMKLSNPFVNEDLWMGPPITVDDPAELSFLDELGSGNTYPTNHNNELAWKLCVLLNEYNAVGHWKASSLATYSTAGFELVFKGPSEDAPSEYLVGDSEMVAILRFHHGTKKGMLCLKC